MSFLAPIPGGSIVACLRKGFLMAGIMEYYGILIPKYLFIVHVEFCDEAYWILFKVDVIN